jgi:hypothetical protein
MGNTKNKQRKVFISDGGIFKKVTKNISSGQVLVYLPADRFDKDEIVMVRKATENEKIGYNRYSNGNKF